MKTLQRLAMVLLSVGVLVAVPACNRDNGKAKTTKTTTKKSTKRENGTKKTKYSKETKVKNNGSKKKVEDKVSYE